VLTPFKTCHQLVLRVGILEVGLGRDGPEKVRLAGRRSTKDLLGGLLPRDGLLQEALLVITQEPSVDQDLDELRKAFISQSLYPVVLA
jgi:hypothetical protein